MKKIVLVFTVVILIASGCGNEKNTEVTQAAVESVEEEITPAGVDLVIKENLFIGQINDVGLNYKNYLGKSIKIEGLFKHQERNGKDFFYVYRRTPGCCGADGEIGYELSWDPNYQGINTDIVSKLGVYPNTDDWVEVYGVLTRYERDGFPSLYLALSEINVLDKRGAEFVRR